MYPTLFTTPGFKAFAEEIDAERQRQLAKFGEQHHPNVDTRDIPTITHHYYASRADIWRQVNTERATPTTGGRCATCPSSASGPHTHTAWDGILLEEAYEAVAESDPAKLRAELVQVAAVCAAWIADIDSLTAAGLRPVAGETRPVPAAAGPGQSTTTTPETTMTTDPTDLLRQAETYLSALRTSVARHDNLGANFTCHGCQLHERITAELAAAPSAPADTGLRERVADAIRGLNPGGGTLADLDEDGDVLALADAAVAVLPAPADRAAVLREAADVIERVQHERDDIVNDALGGLDRITEAEHRAVHRTAAVLRRMADEAPQPRRPFDPQAGLQRLADDLARGEEGQPS